MEEEDDSIKNRGRNNLFELDLYLRFLKAGYSIELGDNPDLLLDIKERKYAIECKRIYSKKGYKKNIQKAMGQLYEYNEETLGKSGILGIVAIDYSRYFFDKNELSMLSANSEKELENKLQELELQFARETVVEFRKMNFPIFIPFIFLMNKRIGYINGIPYSHSRMNLQQTNYPLFKDFDKFVESINGK